jgi:2-polyprenyl-6-methoxyphenol hydroxylase-like FAD-dependent oxidoreductase
MNASLVHDTDVLIIGAGPTGLVLALWLTRLGVRVRIVDKTAEPGTTSRALAIQARTLELYSQAGLADAVIERGRKNIAVNLWVAGKRAAHAVLGEMGTGLSPFPYALIFPQDEHERLVERSPGRGRRPGRAPDGAHGLRGCGESCVRPSETADGTEETCELPTLPGATEHIPLCARRCGDRLSGRSVRPSLLRRRRGGKRSYDERRIARRARQDRFPRGLPVEGRRASAAHRHRAPGSRTPTRDLSWNDVSRRVLEWIGIDVERVNWFSTYRVHHRVAGHFRKGCAFLLGDAAHIHSPVGGQGMNTGIGDAVNLAWKLAAVLQGRADASLLDSYEPERIAFARRLVATTDRAFTAVTSSGAIARLMRLHIVPLLIAPLFALKAARRFMFRTVSQTAVNYRGSSLSEGHAGTVHGGDRLPWVKSGAERHRQLHASDLAGLAGPRLR